MKKISLFKKIFVGIVILIAVIVIGGVVFIETLDLNRYKEQIREQISQSVGQEADIKNLSFTFSINRGLTLDVSGLSIQDDPAFSSDVIFYVDSVHVDVDVLRFLLKRQLHIQKVELHSPRINLIRNVSGELNVEKLGKKKEEKPEEGSIAEQVASINKKHLEDVDKNEEKLTIGELLIRSIHVTDGTFVYEDIGASPSVKIPVTKLELIISNLSLDSVFPVKISAALWSNKENIDVNGLVQINRLNKQVRIDDFKIKSDLSHISPELIYKDIPSTKGAGIEGKIKGDFVLDIAQMILGEEGLLVLSAEGKFKDVSAKIKNVPIPIEEFNMEFELNETDVDVTEMELPLAGGLIAGKARLLDYLSDQNYTTDFNVNAIELSELSAQMDFPAKLDGKINGQFSGAGKGFDLEKLKSNLKGEGSVEVKDGRIIDMNLLKMVLSKLSFIPNVTSKIEENLPEKYKEKLQDNDTVLESMTIETRIQDGSININKAELSADGFVALAKGNMDFDQNLKLEADLFMTKDLSAAMVTAEDQLKYFLDIQKQLHIPFRPYSGKLSNFIMYPDVEDIGKEILRNRGRDELKKVLKKAFDVPDEEQGGASTESEEPAAGEEKTQSPEEAVIENILDLIPIFQE